MGKIIFRILAVGVLLFGAIVVLTSNSKDLIEKFQNAPVISASELSEYTAEEGSYVLVTDIHFLGDTVKDDRGTLDGDYYAIKVIAEARSYGNEDEADKGWYTVNEKSYILIDPELTTDAFPNEKFEFDMAPVKFTKTSNEEDDGFDTYRYQYYAIDDDVTLTALAKIENGKAVHKNLYEYEDYEGGSNYSYLIGNKDTYDAYVEYDLGEGQDGSVLFVAFIVAAILLFISFFFKGKEKTAEN